MGAAFAAARAGVAVRGADPAPLWARGSQRSTVRSLLGYPVAAGKDTPE